MKGPYESAAAGAFEVAALLQHQDFVLALAKSLVRDSDAANDVAQDTWLSALTSPPASAASVRAWLARVTRSRASDHQRSERNRAVRERMASRSEQDSSEADLRERVALQQRVVECVLALREPYRGVILLHYYDGLSAAEIARRRQIPAGTVRAQISRALDLLRDHLDQQSSGDREAWSSALAALAGRNHAAAASVSTTIGTKLAIAGVLVCVAVVVPLALRIDSIRASSSEIESGVANDMLGEPSRSSVADLTEPRVELATPLAATTPATPAASAREPATSVDPGSIAAQKSDHAISIKNGDFEAKPDKDGGIPNWRVAIGARNGGDEPAATVKIDTKEKHGGHASLCLSGDDQTRGWKSAQQDLPLRVGGAYRLTLWAKTEKVHQETVRGTSIQQFANCWVGVFFVNEADDVVKKFVAPATIPNSSWQKISIDIVAPDAARRAFISVSLTMSGTMWVDDFELAITGGKELSIKEASTHEVAAAAKPSTLPAGWVEVVGAHNGNGPARSTITLDKTNRAGGSQGSVHFSGDAHTIQWYVLQRTIDAAPGDELTFRAKVKAKDVRKEGIQFPNFHMSLVFLGADGATLGVPKFAHCGQGSFDWKDVSVSSVAPLGTAKARAAMFLSMSGDAWFDDLGISMQAGGSPPYADWLSHETRHLLLRYSPDNPRAKEIESYGDKLDQTFEDIVKRLAVEYSDRITVYIYRDGDEGKKLTGRELDFSAPEDKTVHQTANSTLGHEMVHCVALKIGYAQTGLLGEGIAVYLNGAPPEEHHKRAANLVAKGALPTQKQLLEEFRNQANGYAAAGSFCGYLVETFGIEKFKQLYVRTDPAEISSAVLGKSFEDVDADWRAFLKSRE